MLLRVFVLSLNCLRSQVSCNVCVELLQLHVMSQWGDEKWTCTSPTELNWALVFRGSLFVLSESVLIGVDIAS